MQNLALEEVSRKAFRHFNVLWGIRRVGRKVADAPLYERSACERVNGRPESCGCVRKDETLALPGRSQGQKRAPKVGSLRISRLALQP
jgi:hypothetical protein